MSPESDQKGTSSSSHQLQISPEVPRLTKRNLRESHSLGVDSMDTGWHPPFFSFRQMFGPRALFKGLPRIGPGANGSQTKPTKSPKWDKSFTFQYLSTPPSGIISNLKHRVQSVNDVCTLKILAYHESWRIWRGNCTRLDPTSHGPSNNYLLNLLSPTLPFHPKERLFGIFLPSPSVIHNCRLLSKRSC